VRIYYAVKLTSTDDITWYSSIFGSIVPIELGIGIVTGCLPVFPKYFNHIASMPLFSGLRTSINSLLLYSRGTRQQTGGSNTTGTGDRQAKLWKASSKSKSIWPKSYTPMPDSYELSLAPKENSSVTASSKNDVEGTADRLKGESDTHITRTVHIAVDSDIRDAASEENLWQASQIGGEPWDGQQVYRSNPR
jgi:hypothetical protein